MANKNVTLTDDSGNNLYPVTLSENVNGLTALLNNLASKDLSNVSYPLYSADGALHTGSGDRVIEMKVSSNGLVWYRKWASGWKECGVYDQTSYNNASRTIALPIPFTTNYYTVCATAYHSSYVSAPLAVKGQAVDSVTVVCTQTTQRTYVYCCGY